MFTIPLSLSLCVVPPRLIRYSNLTTYRPVGGSASFIVDVLDARPPLTLNDLTWSGDFDPSKSSLVYEEDEVVMELSDLALGDGGNITLTARHPAGDVEVTFELIVLSECSLYLILHVHCTYAYACKYTVMHMYLYLPSLKSSC